jgi:undecaprenyl-phosphate 4-deoxy-4-formamido-L-arabinose transferase
LYERLKAALQKINMPYEIIFVDDGSKDATYEILRTIALADKSVIVLSFSKNFGQHTAVIAGIDHAQGEYILTMDADLQNPPEEAARLIEKAKEGYDMISGCRKIRKDTISRRFCSYITNLIIWARTGLRMRDYGSMLRIFKRETAKALAKEFRVSRGYITMLVAKVTRNVAEIETGHDERCAGKSKYSLRKLFSAFWKILFSYNKKPTKDCAGPLYEIGKRIEDGKESV